MHTTSARRTSMSTRSQSGMPWSGSDSPCEGRTRTSNSASELFTRQRNEPENPLARGSLFETVAAPLSNERNQLRIAYSTNAVFERLELDEYERKPPAH